MNLAFIDLETTGTDETNGSILEIGAIVTDEELQPLASWETLVDPQMAHVADMAPVVREMHTASGLLDQLDRIAPELVANTAPDGIRYLPDADYRLAELLRPFTIRGQIVLAGSGVGHFDARWIARHLPRTSKLLTFWTIDVGVVRRFLSMLADVDIPTLNDRKPHRALDDVRLHLAEATVYRDALRAATSTINLEINRPRPGDRTDNAGQPGTLIRCPRCSGDGLLHRPDHYPEASQADLSHRTPPPA